MSSQSSSSIEEQEEIQEQHKLLITSNFVNKSKKFKNHAFIVQGEPFSWGITIKNIDTKPSPEAVVTLAGIRDLNEKYFQCMEENEKYVRSLNPNEEIYIEIDRATIYLEGMQWCYVDIEPKDNSHFFVTYQYDANHKRIVRYSEYEDDNNKWIDHMYIQKKMELLQSRTNQYILLLTVITVWESVFGIKNTIKNLAFIFSTLFNWIAGGIEWLGKLL
ncbi:hypothetical protein [Pseudoalteromonas sp. T1lg10]|uniref:hypothetical protein n=1 Tax=Pseudoalteromonas sp. T1lg10 TaxID=2077093 RepID=UPI000CF71D6C|nr:hypothetical protein [Pseudoalteromonas sp. T1lg10]